MPEVRGSNRGCSVPLTCAAGAAQNLTSLCVVSAITTATFLIQSNTVIYRIPGSSISLEMDQSTSVQPGHDVTAAGEGNPPPQPTSNAPTESKEEKATPTPQKQKIPDGEEEDDDEESDLDDLDGKQGVAAHRTSKRI